MKNLVKYLSQDTSISWLIIAFFSLSVLTGCKPGTHSPERSSTGQLEAKAPSTTDKQQPAKPSGQHSLTRKVTFRGPDGVPRFSLQIKATGARFTTPSGKTIANLIGETEGAIKLTDENNKTVGYISQDNEGWQIESAKRSKVLFTFRQTEDGNAVLTRNNGSVLYTLEAIEGGYQVIEEKPQYSVDTRKGGGQLKTEEGEVVIATDSAIAPAALASFGFAKLTLVQRAGLAHALMTETFR